MPFLFQILRSTYLKILRSFSVIFFLWDPCLHLGKSKIFGWNRIISFFLIPSALISLFLLGVGNIFGAACQLCIAWISSFLESLQALTVFTKRIFLWRLVSWRFLVCVNSEIFQLQIHVYWIFFFTIGFNGVVLKVFVNPCLFPWVCHARLFCFFKLQSVSLWYSCSDSLNSFLDNTLIFSDVQFLEVCFLPQESFGWLSFSQKHVAVSSSVFLLNPKTIPAVPSTNSFVISDLFSRSQTHSKWTAICIYLLEFDFGGTLRFVDGSRSFPKIVFWNPPGKRGAVRPCSGRC